MEVCGDGQDVEDGRHLLASHCHQGVHHFRLEIIPHVEQLVTRKALLFDLISFERKTVF